MKSFLLSSILCLIVQVGFGQATDTLGWANFQAGTSTLYSAPNGGFAFGNNGYGDKAKAQSYSDTSSFVLNGILMLFGEVIFESLDSSSFVRVNVYNNYGEGVTSAGVSDSIAPDSVLMYVDVPVFELTDDGSFSFADFSDSTLAIFNRFSVGIDLTHLSQGDTVGLLSTEDGDAAGSANAWELTSNDVWFTIEESAYSWDLDVDLAIFPIIDENHPAGIQEGIELNWKLYPNPTREQVWVAFPHSDIWIISISDFLGKKVIETDIQGDLIKLNISELKSGTYFLSVSNDKYRSILPLIVN